MPRDREKGFPPPRRPCMSLCSAACGHKPETIPRKNQEPKKGPYLYTLLLRVYPIFVYHYIFISATIKSRYLENMSESFFLSVFAF